MLLRVEIQNIRPISHLSFEIDLSQHGIFCIVGKNGAGKTTLAKAIMNLALADTFVKTSLDSIFNVDSKISYTVGAEQYLFTYDENQRTVTSRKPVQLAHKNLVSVEMPVPHGQRFTFFRTLADRDDEIRQSVVLERYTKPTELIEFLSDIYRGNRFDELVEIEFSRGVCCCFVLPDKRYIREDYFSSGEYFLINLFRKLSKKTPLVVIDEIDVSLDASTQARLANQLRRLCVKNESTLVFTTHSLALMQTLEPGEIRYLERANDKANSELEPMSFNGVKFLMFGFKGFDRYILTEDERLKQLLEYIIARYCSPTFYSYQVIHVGGHGYIKRMMEHNADYGYLGPANCVIGVKDGDQADNKQAPQIYCLPIKNIEDAFHALYHATDFPHQFDECETLNPKLLYKKITTNRHLSTAEICMLVCDRHDAAMKHFAKDLSKFLCR